MNLDYPLIKKIKNIPLETNRRYYAAKYLRPFAKEIAAFLKLLKAFPHSPYTVEANAKVLAARNFLANHEFYVASFYIRTELLPLAEARLRYLLANYPETTVAAEAKVIIAAIDAGNPPQRTWRDWIPDISLPDWHTFTSISPGASQAVMPE